MWLSIVSLVVLAGLAALAGAIRDRRLHRQPEAVSEAMPGVAGTEGCCGQHEVCEKESLLAAVSRKIEYYDDEELDKYAGTPSDSYTPLQEDEFRDIFYTMRDEDVTGWIRSLQLRGIALPDSLRDEVFLVVGELRSDAASRRQSPPSAR